MGLTEGISGKFKEAESFLRKIKKMFRYNVLSPKERVNQEDFKKNSITTPKDAVIYSNLKGRSEHCYVLILCPDFLRWYEMAEDCYWRESRERELSCDRKLTKALFVDLGLLTTDLDSRIARWADASWSFCGKIMRSVMDGQLCFADNYLINVFGFDKRFHENVVYLEYLPGGEMRFYVGFGNTWGMEDVLGFPSEQLSFLEPRRIKLPNDKYFMKFHRHVSQDRDNDCASYSLHQYELPFPKFRRVGQAIEESGLFENLLKQA